jgi:hypothetical protein
MEDGKYEYMPEQLITPVRKVIPVQKIGFDEFYKEFETVREILETDAWKETWSNYYSLSWILIFTKAWAKSMHTNLNVKCRKS